MKTAEIQVISAFAFILLSTACAEPSTYNPPAPDRAGGTSGGPGVNGGSAQSGAMAGASGAGNGAAGASMPSTNGGGSGGNGSLPGAGGAPGGDGPATSGCPAGTTRCAAGSAMVEVCTTTGIWENQQTCDFVCAVNGASAACAGDCKPGEKRCGGAQMLAPELCDDSGKWVANGSPCPNLCSSGSCGGSCPPNKRQCGPNQTPQLCSPQGTWEPQPACDRICMGEGVCGGDCKPGAQQCSPTEPLIRQTCDQTGHWMRANVCPFACSNGSCGGSCVANSKKCSGSNLQTCRPDGSTYDNTPCPNGCTGDRCNSCKPGASTCANNIVSTCRADGSAFDMRPQTTCTSGDGCCPSTCNNNSDKDCPAVCGNSEKEAGELCDPCPATCAPRGCMTRRTSGGPCQGTCVDDANDPALCPKPPTNATATCNSGTCGVQCRDGFKTCPDKSCKAMNECCQACAKGCMTGSCLPNIDGRWMGRTDGMVNPGYTNFSQRNDGTFTITWFGYPGIADGFSRNGRFVDIDTIEVDGLGRADVRSTKLIVWQQSNSETYR